MSQYKKANTKDFKIKELYFGNVGEYCNLSVSVNAYELSGFYSWLDIVERLLLVCWFNSVDTTHNTLK